MKMGIQKSKIFLNNAKKVLLFGSLGFITISTKQTLCYSMFEEMDKQFEQIQKNMSGMRNMFAQMEEEMLKNNENMVQFDQISTKNSINIQEKDKSAIISIDLGKNIKDFEAKIQTKKDGFKQDQITIKAREDKNQNQNMSITIKANENYLSITQNSCSKTEKKEESKEINNKEQNIFTSSISTGQTFTKNLDISKTIIEYDEKTGILTLTVPEEKLEENTGKVIDIKIKK